MKQSFTCRVCVALASVVLLPGVVAAQEPSPAPAIEAPAATAPTPAPTPVPTPLPVLMGPAYPTMRALAAALQTETQHIVAAAETSVPMGRRMIVMNVRMFSRRTANFRNRVDLYQTQPFDIVGEVTQMRTRAGMISTRQRAAQVMETTYEDWDVALDVLDRMIKLLNGEKVTVPPAHTPRPVPTPDPHAPAAVGDRPGAMRTLPRPAAPAVATPPPAPTPSPSPSPKS